MPPNTPRPPTPEKPFPWGELRCRFGCDPERNPVVGIYHAPKGCLCYLDPVQALCAQHAIKGTQNNDMHPLIERVEFLRRKTARPKA